MPASPQQPRPERWTDTAIAELHAELSAFDYAKAHYCGSADEVVMRMLVDRVELVSVMDMQNRWGTETEFDSVERRHDSRRRDWMKHIRFYYEGFPACDLYLSDWEGDFRSTLERITVSRRFAPTTIMLVGTAAHEPAGDTLYAWHPTGGVTIGRLFDVNRGMRHPERARHLRVERETAAARRAEF